MAKWPYWQSLAQESTGKVKVRREIKLNQIIHGTCLAEWLTRGLCLTDVSQDKRIIYKREFGFALMHKKGEAVNLKFNITERFFTQNVSNWSCPLGS